MKLAQGHPNQSDAVMWHRSPAGPLSDWSLYDTFWAAEAGQFCPTFPRLAMID
jgi:hypothetical protein